uniref:TBC1 domain family member 5-like isoform X2 n=1 Tax=Erigeron canadensis TaxID=72917 RepID=UPI001CB8E4F2|nr:TBC1 domain family member 5-like isoform X2 [Erigeron canadensis]
MSPSAPVEPTHNTMPESSSSGELSPGKGDTGGFGDLRGVQWRIHLGILPCSSLASSVDHFRRVTANSRRSYAALRRRLLINPHISKDESKFRDLVMDNPLSQNPESMWGRFFHKAELERMVDQDLSRLYPEHGSYFQAPGCQGVLRRVLLLWCIRHPNYGYRQGMHELLAPLLFVLQADLECLSEVRRLYQDYFTDNFDGLSFNESDLEKVSDNIQTDNVKVNDFKDLDPKIQTIISFSDAYGAEGELGIVLSEKFMEHDAYSMFDALMSGDGGAVAMASFFSHSPSPHNGLPPVIEASSALYHLLSIVDLSLYTHLVELGVEPQYFALRWLRVLFGREFALKCLLIVWDEIFALDNDRLSGSSDNESEVTFRVLNSSRGAFISALAVSMILHLRSSLLATENATSCLQKLLNFPEDVNLRKLLKKAKSLMNIASDAIKSIVEPIHGGGPSDPKKSRGRSLSSDFTAPGSPHRLVPESYWEEKWRVLNKETEQKEASLSKQVQNRLKGWSEKVKMRLSRTRSAGFLSKVARPPIMRNLVDDAVPLEKEKLVGRGVSEKRSCSSVDGGSEENSYIFSDLLNPHPRPINDNYLGKDNEGTRVASNSSSNGNDLSLIVASVSYSSSEEVASPLPVSVSPEAMSCTEVKNEMITENPVENLRDKTLVPGKFQWLWMFARNGPDDLLEKSGYISKPSRSSVTELDHKNVVPSSSTIDEFIKPEADDQNNMHIKPEADDQNNMYSLKTLAQSMIENVKVIEFVLLQETAQKEPVENFSENAMVALNELRKISNLISMM